ncbi:MAG: type IX secretion system outer membrane channel protein PorV [Lewinellaceae bacterium]|nr:type IX secretion system outer membrane channel protein PorV [Saprospiraceae bacterium]MCB9312117.1 type IX secretion system outer membrane channel protein PorV [Lewinellaceae bacterium]HRW75817.1 type IX secretion system outer membrane channel protein PorV [Saprospiraceae bacterium]
MKKLLVLALAIGMISPAMAQREICIGQTIGGDCINTIFTAVPFLRINPDARSGGMGDVGIGISPDANSMHFNASKLAFAEQDLSFAANYTPWLRNLGLNDVYLAYLSGYKRLGDLQTIGFGLRYFSLGSIQYTGLQGESRGTGRPNEFELAAAYARKLSDNFSVGITGKFIFSNLASGQEVDGNIIDPGIAGAADISATYIKKTKFNDRPSTLRLGVVASNIGSKITYTNSQKRDFLPANLGLGAAWEMQLDDHNSLTIALDINKLMVPTPDTIDADNDNRPDYRDKSPIEGMFSSFGDAPGGFNEEMREFYYSLGLEYWYDNQFALRAGYFFEDITKGGRRYFTLGLGVKYNIFGINISYLVPTTSQRNPLDNTLRFSMLFDFGVFGATE